MRLSQYYLPREHWRALIDILLAVLDPRLAPVWVVSLAGGWALGGARNADSPLGLGVLAAGRPERGALLARHPLSDPAALHVPRARARRRPARLDLRSRPCHPPGRGRPARVAPAHAPGVALLPGRDRPPLGPLRGHPQRGAGARGGPLDVEQLRSSVSARGLGADPEHPRDRPRRVRSGLGLGSNLSDGDGGATLQALAATTVLGGLAVAASTPRNIDPRRLFYPNFRDYVAGWIQLELRAGPAGTRVAYAGTNLPYYLMGMGLRNDVRYVNVDAHRHWLLHDYHRAARSEGQATWPHPRPGWDRIHPDYDAWLANLRAEKIRILVVARANPVEGPHNIIDPSWFPIERVWAETHPETFEPIYGVAENDPLFRLYRVRQQPLRDSDGRLLRRSRPSPLTDHFSDSWGKIDGSAGRLALLRYEPSGRDRPRPDSRTAGPHPRSREGTMRLTLRTLLAWLDDTLSPAEVREIGKQVAESPFAQELKDRIHLVSRQRRLTIPPSDGPKATDPNLVAAYLDNELAPEHVADFEKLCLTSDVNLAEVASVHQILSLIGQKAKVPSEARHRMYNLVKGRETVAVKSRRAPKRTEPAPQKEPVQPWAAAPTPERSSWDRYLIPLGVVALLMVLSWSAWMSIPPTGPRARANPPGQVALAPAKAPADPEPAPPAGAPPAVVPAPEAPKPADPAKDGRHSRASHRGPGSRDRARADGPRRRRATPSPADAEKKAQPRDELPEGAIGKVETSSGPLLRWNAERGEWERLSDQSPLKDRDRLLNLSPYRASLVLGTARVELVGETEISVSTPSPDQEARFRLETGRVVVHGGSAGNPFAVQFADRTVLVTPPAGSPVGLERSDRREQGSPLPSPSLLRIYSTQGEVALSVDDSKETLPGPGSIAFEPPGRWTDKSDKPAPSWVDDATPSPFDKQVGDQFLEFFRADRPIVANLVEALDDDQKDVRRLAIAALGALGDLSMIVPVLSKAQDPSSRRAAATVLRDHLAHGPESAKRVQEQLINDLGEEVAATTYKLLVGYTPDEAKEPATYSTLVKLLSSDDVGIRDLALDNLQSLTGRDTLDYDPDEPEGKGLKAWRDLLRDRELRPQATRDEP